MDAQTAFKVVLLSVAIVTLIFSCAAIWLSIHFAKLSTAALKASAEATGYIAASVGKIEFLLTSRPQCEGQEEGAGPHR